MTKNISNPTGFINGYIAGNIAANNSELKSHTNTINSFLHQFKSTLNVIDIDKGVKNQISDRIDRLENESKFEEWDLENYYKYSQDLSEVLLLIKTSIDKEQRPTESNFLIKRAIFHFLNVAKTLNDKRIIDTALVAASLFK